MKRFTAIILALLLVFSLSVTALAENANIGANNQGATTVSIQATSSQLSVTVPTTVTLSIKQDGTFTAPENYAIVNNSVFNVHVSDIDVALAEGSVFTFDGANKLALTLAPQTTADPQAWGPTVALRTGMTFVSSAQWSIAAKTGEAGVSLPLQIAGSVTNLNASVTTEADEAFIITYTIAAGAYTAT